MGPIDPSSKQYRHEFLILMTGHLLRESGLCMRQFCIPLCSLLVLGACGGGSGPFAPTDPADNGGPQIAPYIPAFDSAAAASDSGLAALNRIDAGGLTDPADFQRSGTARFSGAIVLNDENPVPAASVFGGLTMEVDFANQNNVTAQAGNFFDLADTRVTGTLTMRGAEFSEGALGGGLVGDLTGTLQNVGPTGVDNDYAYNTSLAALFYGVGVDGMLIIAEGTARQVGLSSDVVIDGAATLERDD